MNFREFSQNRFLVIDPDPPADLRADPRVTVVRSEQEIADVLRSQPHQFALVSEDFSELSGLPIVKNLLETFPNIPVFYVTQGDAPKDFPTAEALFLGIRGCVKRQVKSADLLRALFAIVEHTPENPCPIANRRATRLDELVEADLAFIPDGVPLAYDLYAIDRAGQVIRIHRAGDAFHKLHSQGIYYVRKNANRFHLEACDQMMGRLFASQLTTFPQKMKWLNRYGTIILNSLKKMGAEPEVVDSALLYSTKAFEALGRTDLIQKAEAQELLASLKNFEHSVAISIISCLFATRLLESEKPLTAVGLAGLLHDIGIQKLPTDLRTKSIEQMSLSELKLYQKHPDLSVEILSSSRSIDSMVLQGIAHHHERRDRSGYPNRLGSGTINRVGELVGLAEETFERLILPSQPESFVEFQARFIDQFSQPVFDAASTFVAGTLKNR